MPCPPELFFHSVPIFRLSKGMENDQYKYRNELLRQYVYLAFTVSLLIAPLEYLEGMRELGIVLNVFSAIMAYLIFLTRASSTYVRSSRLFMVAISCLFFAGFLYSTPEVDNKYFLLLYPIASFSIRGVKEGIIWAASLMLLFVMAFFALPHGNADFSFVFFAVAFFMVSYVVYYYRFYELLNFEHISKVQEEKERVIRLKEAEASRLKHLSHTDFLTGLFNRHKLDAVLAEEIGLCQSHGRPLGFMLLDVDHFKQVNDTYGHQVGDELLQEMAELLRTNVRVTDVVGRWGGEEFVVVTPGIDLQSMATLAEKLRAVVECHHFPVVGKKTVSIGIAGYVDGDGVESLVRRSDEALYRAKNGGRNRVEQG